MTIQIILAIPPILIILTTLIILIILNVSDGSGDKSKYTSDMELGSGRH